MRTERDWESLNRPWLALAIGNSRLHWAFIEGNTIQQTWDTPHWSEAIVRQLIHHHFETKTLLAAEDQARGLDPSVEALTDFPLLSFSHPPSLWLASVVPAQTRLWQTYPHARLITLEDLPLQNLYPTLGIDRALALLGAMDFGESTRPKKPVLVIDAGTALTFTGADANRRLVGGAILPGLGLQVRSLTQQTALLPSLTFRNFNKLPPRWATHTPEAMSSGILHTLLAGIQDFVEDWLVTFPDSAIALTGGDSAYLYAAWQQRLALSPMRFWREGEGDRFQQDPHLGFKGILSVRNHLYRSERDNK